MQLRTRIAKLEQAATKAVVKTWLRIIQDGDLTPEQQAQLEDAQTNGSNIVIRKVIDPQT